MKTNKVLRILGIVIPIILAIVSVVAGRNYFDTDEFRAPYIAALEQKQKDTTRLSLAAAGTSIVIAAVPDDSTTPVAEEIAGVSSRLIAVTAVILLEKCIMGAAGRVSFMWLFPAACLLWLAYNVTGKRAAAHIAFRVAAFAACIFFLVPLSIQIDRRLDEKFATSNIIEQAIETAEETSQETAQEEKGFFKKASNFISGIGESIKALPEETQQKLGSFMDGVAVMILTVCVTPIATLFVMLFVIRTLMISFTLPLTKGELEKVLDKMGVSGASSGEPVSVSHSVRTDESRGE